MRRKKYRAKLMGPLRCLTRHGGALWSICRDLRGVAAPYKTLWCPMGHLRRLTPYWELWVMRGRLYEVWEVYGDPKGSKGGDLYKVSKVYRWDPRMS